MLDAETFSGALSPLLRRSAGYAAALLGSRSAAEDAVQQAALKAWEKRALHDPRQPFRPWWFAILRNQCLDDLRRRKRAPAAVPFDDIAPTSPPDESAFDRLAIEAALRQLPDLHREILTLRYFAELSYEELAQLLDIPKGTVMSRLHLARKALAGFITPEAP